jgi:hypothetical protein
MHIKCLDSGSLVIEVPLARSHTLAVLLLLLLLAVGAERHAIDLAAVPIKRPALCNTAMLPWIKRSGAARSL